MDITSLALAKSYTDKKIADIQAPEASSDDICFVYLKKSYDTALEYNLTEMNKAMKNFPEQPVVIILTQNSRSNNYISRIFCIDDPAKLIDITNYTGSISWYSDRAIVGQKESSTGVWLTEGCVRIDVKFTNGVVTSVNTSCNSTSYSEQYKLPVLGTGGQEVFTPTTDYQPATKKYVDDTITAAITAALEGEY